ncbi:TetR/AcrR family transcriptional regulator [Skermania sp. ID1734]|uniref:TetR/AcrR family transcriptional regulator n=1 Tax=Skermania sp. ID1734 TaxID=2597516 RepID=UPI00117F3F3F|nr:TetR/AcrR family transcriptional regulator [Skermania sp. ID1734]TSD99320.1 TetR/AcrR family transcriptional regulator [Skermania sp. ID1734]
MAVDPGLVEQLLGAQAPDADPAILDGALEAFLEFGIKRASMGEIAKRANLSPATLYRRFPSKAAVVQAVGMREAQRLIAAVDARVDSAAPAEDQLTELFVVTMGQLSGNQLIRRLLITEPESVLPYLTTGAGPLLSVGRAYIAQIYRRLQATGQLADFNADESAEIAARLALSLVLTPDGLIPVDDEQQARRFAREHLMMLVPIRRRDGSAQ